MSRAANSILLGSAVRSTALGALTLLRVCVVPISAGTWIAQRIGIDIARSVGVSQ